MNALASELQRLFFLPGQDCPNRKTEADDELSPSVAAAQTPDALLKTLAGERTFALELVSADRRVRALVITLVRASDWGSLAALYQGVQDELELPPPALSVSPEAGLQVWFSLAVPVPLPAAERFLRILRQKYLADIPEARLSLQPADGRGGQGVSLVPSWHAEHGRWSAFIDPAMAGMFVDELGLEIAPNLDRQAEMLARIRSIPEKKFQQVLALSEGLTNTGECPAGPHGDSRVATLPPAFGSEVRWILDGPFSDPKTFLFTVMNDPSANVGDRIQAAEALLPYFHKVSEQ